uniref:Putative secreted protein n=1 Tax=Ixodes ricinus TaxID=34613 RepID=A0A6B0U6Z6_IXORI
MVAAVVVVFFVVVVVTETGGDFGTSLRSHRTWCFFACAWHLRRRSEPDTCRFRLSFFFFPTCFTPLRLSVTSPCVWVGCILSSAVKHHFVCQLNTI